QGHYYEFSSVFFYTNRTALLITDRRVNLEYGSNAPGAPRVFIDDSQFQSLWMQPNRRYYLLTFKSFLAHYEGLIGSAQLHKVAESGGKILLTNEALEQKPLSPVQVGR